MPSNPFITTFGLEPSNLINRTKESEKIINDFLSDQPNNYVNIITGLRGSGKTVLLSTISNYFKQLDDWIVTDAGPKNNILENIASDIYENGKMKNLFLKKEFSFSFHGLSFSIEGDEPISSTMAIIKKMLDYLTKKGKKVLITIDEIDNSDDMKYFVQAYQSLLRQNYPVRLLMTGLYDNIYKLQNDKSLTFLYRAPKIVLEPLNISLIATSYQKYLSVDENTAIELAKFTKGYAYAYQVLGYLLFNANKKNIDLDIIRDFDSYLNDYVYDKLYSELSKNEQYFCLAIKDNFSHKTSEIVDILKSDIKTISVYRDRLIKQGIIYSPAYGYVEFTLPRFAEYLRIK